MTSIEEILWMRSRYDLDKIVDIDRHRNRSQSMITEWHVIPAFESWGRHIILETMKVYEKTVLYFSSSCSCPPQILNVMHPVNFRRQTEDINDDPLSSDQTEVLQPVDDKFLYVISKYLLQRPKNFTFTRLLIIGGSSATFSILETLCLNSNVCLMNVTVVMEYVPISLSMEAELEGKQLPEKYPLSADEINQYSEEELRLLGLNHKAKYIRGKVTDIDRKNRTVILSDESVIEYDILVLSATSQDCSVRKFPSTKGFHPSSLMRRGIFCLGNTFVDAAALDWVKTGMLYEKNIVVYGSNLTTVNVIEKLISIGIDPSLIVVVSDKSYVADFGHPSLQQKADNIMNSCGVKLFLDCDILDVFFDESLCIESIKLSLSSKLKYYSDFINCRTLICCMDFYLDTDLHVAVNESGLVYDGGIVVDKVISYWLKSC